MQLASHGLHRAAAQIKGAAHFSTRVPRATQVNNTVTRKLFNYSRHIVSQIVEQLAAPGLPAPAHSFKGTRVSSQSVRHGLSLPARFALGRPSGHFPRAPAVAHPHGFCATNMGLGTARGFHAGQPLFRNLVENVPVAVRSLSEIDMGLDWEIKAPTPVRAKMPPHGKEKAPHMAFKAKPVKISHPENNNTKEELQHYFPEPTTSQVSTHVLVPLAPTPTTRVPLSAIDISAPSILPPSALHVSHADHATRVSALFASLDALHLPSSEMIVSSYGDSRGTCTVLRIELKGWTAEEVRGVIGDTARGGWLTIREIRDGSPSQEDSIMKSSRVDVQVDPSHSLVLPTLDFSSTFHDRSSVTNTPADEYDDAYDSDDNSSGIVSLGGVSSTWSESSSAAHSPMSSQVSLASSYASGNSHDWVSVGFSSSFSHRIGSENQPI